MGKRKGLGRGLEALLPDLALEAREGVREIPVDEIRPRPGQPRRTFREESLQELAASMREHGVVQPLIVRKVAGGGYELVAGERRWRAARLAGMKTVPAIVRPLSDAQALEVSLIENLQREDLNPLEEAEAYRQLMEIVGLTQEQLAERVGKSRSHIANMLRLLSLPDEVKEYVSRGTLSMGHARALLSLPSAAAQIALARKVARQGLSVRQVEAAVKGRGRRPSRSEEPELRHIEDRLRMALGTQVRVVQGRKRGKIEIMYYSPEDLERLLELLAPENPRR